MMKWLKNVGVILVIMAASAAVRTYDIHNALGDWHSWRQADTASVAREYVKHGIDLLHPKYQDLSSIPSGLDNPLGYRFVEFPIMNAIHAELYLHFPSVGLVEWGRILSIVASVATVGLIYLIVNGISGWLPAVLSASVFAFLPYDIYYGRVVLAEPWLVFGMMLSLWAFIKYWDTARLRYWITCLLALTFAILMKPTALVVGLPMLLYMLTKWNTKRFLSLIPLAASILPYMWWRHWMAQFPEGIPASSWLFNGNGIRFKGAWFRWLFGDRIGYLILGYWGLVPLGMGLSRLGAKRKELAIYGGLALGALAYMAVIATGNVQHDYYQIQIMPAVAILVGIGLDTLIKSKKGFGRVYTVLLASSIMLLASALSWYRVQGYFWVNNHAMVIAGQKIDQITPKDALVIAPYQGDTAFLFQTNRRGWPIGGNIENDIKEGASYYVTTTKDAEFDALKKQYGVLVDTPDYAIIKLTK